jgi:hypothetical protein
VQWEKNKKIGITKAIGIGLLAARFQYGLYVGRLSKWFTFSFFSRLFVFMVSSFTLDAQLAHSLILAPISHVSEVKMV